MKRLHQATDARRIRYFNERSILAEMRQRGLASKPEIARSVALTPQAVHGIIEVLVDAGLVQVGGRKAGTVGHPSTLFRIRPGGAYSMGLTIERQGMEIALVDFAGSMVCSKAARYPEPDAARVAEAIASGLEAMHGHMREASLDERRLVGIGVALPAFMTDASCPPGRIEGAMRSWRHHSAVSMLAEFTDLPIYPARSGVASAVAEHMAAGSHGGNSFLYVSLGSFIDAGLIIDGEIRYGENGRAAQIALLPVEVPEDPSRPWVPLYERVSLCRLYHDLRRAGAADASAETLPALIRTHGAVIDRWLEGTASCLLTAFMAVQATSDLEAVVIDADLPDLLVDRLIDCMCASAQARFSPAMVAPRIERTRLGHDAALLGAAMLPLYEIFAPKVSGLAGRARGGP